jgi:hypothetical protein
MGLNISFDKLLTVPSTIETFNFNVGSNDKFNLYTIKSHSLRTIFDYDIYKQFEYFGNTIIGMSPSEYKVQSIDKKLSDIMYNGLGSKQQLPVELETKSGIMIKSKSQANRQKRWFNIGAINNYNMSITVIGSSARKVGSIIKINNNGYDGNIDNNKILSGYWLVYGIKDTIIKNNHYGQELMIAKIMTEV